jgi:hypothetical protein
MNTDIALKVEECLAELGCPTTGADNSKATRKTTEGKSNVASRCIVCTLPLNKGCRHAVPSDGTGLHAGSAIDGKQTVGNILDGPHGVKATLNDLGDVLEGGWQSPSSSFGLGVKLPHGIYGRKLSGTVTEDDDAAASSGSSHQWSRLAINPMDKIDGKEMDLSSPPPSLVGHSVVLLSGEGRGEEQDTRHLIVYGGFILSGTSSCSEKEDVRESPAQIWWTESSSRSCGGLHVYRFDVSAWHRIQIAALGDNLEPRPRYGHVAVALSPSCMWVFGGRVTGGDDASVWLLHTHSLRRTPEWEEFPPNSSGPRPSGRCWSAAVALPDCERVLLFGGCDLILGRNLDDLWIWSNRLLCWEHALAGGIPPAPRFGHSLLLCPEGRVMVMGGCLISPREESEALEEAHDLQLQFRKAVDAAAESRMQEGELLRRAASLRHFPGDGAFARSQAMCMADLAFAEGVTDKKEQSVLELKTKADAAEWRARDVQHGGMGNRSGRKRMDTLFLQYEIMMWEVELSERPRVGAAPPPSQRMLFSASVAGQRAVVWGGALPATSTIQPVEDSSVYVMDLRSCQWMVTRPAPHSKSAERGQFAAAPSSYAVLEAAIAQLRLSRASLTATRKWGSHMEALEAEAAAAVALWRVNTLRADVSIHEGRPPKPRAGANCASAGSRVFLWGGYFENLLEEAKGSEDGMLILDLEQPLERFRRLEREFHLRLERERVALDDREALLEKQAAAARAAAAEAEARARAEEALAMTDEDARSTLDPLSRPPAPRCGGTTPFGALLICWDPLPAARPSMVVDYMLWMRQHGQGWEIVYIGTDSRALITVARMQEVLAQGAVIDSEFSLQTKGCDWPPHRLSQHSATIRCRWSAPVSDQAPCGRVRTEFTALGAGLDYT